MRSNPQQFRVRHRTRISGVIAATSAILLATLPAAAHAEQLPSMPATQSITVQVGDPLSSEAALPLAGARLTVRNAQDMQATVAMAKTAADGMAVVQLDHAEDTSYIVDVEYPGFTSYGSAVLARAEFHPLGETSTTITIEHGFGVVSGTASAVLAASQADESDESRADLAGAQLSVLSGGIEVQRITLGADGRFTSTALLTSDGSAPSDEATGGDYSFELIPADGYELAGEQPGTDTSFVLPKQSASPASITLYPVFALIGAAANPAPAPGPEPAPDPEPAPASPDLTGVAVNIGNDSNVSDATQALGDMGANQFGDLVYQTNAADGPVFIANGSNQVLGLVLPVSGGVQTPTIPFFQGRGLDDALPTGTDDLAVLDIEAALQAAQNARTGAATEQLTDRLEAVQERNSEIARLNAAQNALTTFIETLPPEGCAHSSNTDCQAAHAKLLALQAALGESQVEHPLSGAPLESTADVNSAREAAEQLFAGVGAEIDGMSNSQQMDMLRLQSLMDKRNEASHTMENWIKLIKDQRSRIVGTMRSEPTSIGSVIWDGGTFTGAFDLSRVPAGQHHLILEFADLGVTLVSGVTVAKHAGTEAPVTKQAVKNGHVSLAKTGSAAGSYAPFAGLTLVILGAIAMATAQRIGRRTIEMRDSKGRGLT